MGQDLGASLEASEVDGMVDGRFRERWDKSISNLSWSDGRFFDILGSLKMDSSVQSTENSSRSSSWGSRRSGSGGSQVGNYLAGRRNQRTYINCVQDHMEFRESLVVLQCNMHNQQQ